MPRLSYSKTQDLDCPLCRTTHECPVDQDEDGFYAEIETQPCHDDNCTRQLCPCCPQFTCFCCGLTFCLESSHVGREEEPECNCTFGGDWADTRGCDRHGRHPVKVIYWCRVCEVLEVYVQRMQPRCEAEAVQEVA